MKSGKKSEKKSKKTLKKKKLSSNITTIILILIFLVGLSVMLYPTVSNYINQRHQSKAIAAYDEKVSEMKPEDYTKYFEAAEKYNKKLAKNPSAFYNPDEIKGYEKILDISGTGIMGYITIKKLGVELPIYHGTGDEVLQKAAGHLEGSSLPIGGESTHAVISAHRGLPSASLFTDLDQLEIGDHFLIHVLDETLCYEVDQILVVDPEDTSALAVEDGEDLVTLLTCTPYGVNTQRLMVRGHRVPYEEQAVADEQTPLSGFSLHTNYLLWVVVGIVITGVFILILFIREKKLQKKAAKQKESEE